MKISFLILLAINAVSGTAINTVQYPLNDGNTDQTGGASEATGELYRAISTSGISDTSSGPSGGEGTNFEDDKLITDILAQVGQSDGLPKDLFNSVLSSDGSELDVNGLLAQLQYLRGDSDDDNDDDADLSQVDADKHPNTETDGSGQGSSTSSQGAYGTDTGTSTDAGSGTATTSSEDNDAAPTKDITAFVLGQLGVAKKIFENAKIQIQEAEDDDEEVDAASAVSASTRVAAASVIASAKAEARGAILGFRKRLLMLVDKAKRDITVMKILEKRFRILAIAFGTARTFAGKAILALKNLNHESGEDDDQKSYGYSSSKKDTFLSAAAAAKSKIAKMKEVEKSFLSMTRALAKVRALAYTSVRKVRKGAIGIAQEMTRADMAVKAAIDTAKSLITQAIVTARATALVKAEVSSVAAQKAQVQAQLAVKLAASALAAAKEHSGTPDNSGSSEEVDGYGTDSTSQSNGADVLSSASTTVKSY